MTGQSLNRQTEVATVPRSMFGLDERHRKARKNRRVRLNYPAALVELALVLGSTVGTRQAASALGLNLSTIYRWIGQHRNAWVPRNSSFISEQPKRAADVISILSSRCALAGFPLRSPLLNVEPSTTLTKRSIVSDSDLPIADCHAKSQRIPAVVAATKKENVASDSMIRAKREIDSRYKTRLSCQHLANLVAMPRLRFIKVFAATFGVPPYHYLIGIRVQHAWEMLERSNAPLHEVAAAAGFGSAASMQRAFKHFAGASPAKIVNTISPMGRLSHCDSDDEQMLAFDKARND